MSVNPRVCALAGACPRYSLVGGRTWLTYPELDLPGLAHGIVVFSELHPGMPHEQWTGAVQAYLMRAGLIAGLPIVFCRQVHGAGVGNVRRGRVEPAGRRELDALVTSESSVAVAVTVADCLPLLAVSEAGAIGVAHCGWRGVAAGVVEAFVGALGAQRTRFLIGPGIGPCCYVVRDDMLTAFGSDAEEYSVTDGQRTAFDLRRAVLGRLLGSGVSGESVFADATCTSCRKDVLSSYRANGAHCGRMVAFVARTGRPAEVIP